MLEAWLQPIRLENIVNEHTLEKWHFGKNIILFHQEFPNIRQVQAAIIGMSESTDAVRTQLYRMAYNFEYLRVADLGNVIDADEGYLFNVLQQLLQDGILPIVIGEQPQHAKLLFDAIHHVHDYPLNLTFIDAQCRFSRYDKKHPNPLNAIVKHKAVRNISLLGYQTHLTDNYIIKYLLDKNFDCIRLGKLRDNLEEAEPIIRDAHIVSAELHAVRAADIAYANGSILSGMFVEEICQLMRYAGMSEKLWMLGLWGLAPDDNEHAANCVAQMVWYFLDGVANRKGDYPFGKGSLIEYIVALKDSEEQLLFWKSIKTMRWWVQIPVSSVRRKAQYSQLVPCSYNDYRMACEGELSERMVSIYQKIST
ncbi:MAG: hypothetical protein KA974_03725 [Saprospiraceae bacterium]|nr:hypothetical protein [Saprospiraceae bacterium]MBP7699453.1 hypothetical protein [Saprospiraceae bacterium]